MITTLFILCLVQAELPCLVVSVLALSLTWPSKTWIQLLVSFSHAHLIGYLSGSVCVFVRCPISIVSNFVIEVFYDPVQLGDDYI